MTVKSDQRKDALLQETKVAFQTERDKIANRLRELETERSSLDEYKKSTRKENLEMVERADRLEFDNRELASKVRSLNEFLAAKEREYDDLVMENESNKKSLKKC